MLPAFNNLVANDTEDDAVAEILNNHYIVPRESCFYMVCLNPRHVNNWNVFAFRSLFMLLSLLWCTHPFH